MSVSVQGQEPSCHFVSNCHSQAAFTDALGCSGCSAEGFLGTSHPAGKRFYHHFTEDGSETWGN